MTDLLKQAVSLIGREVAQEEAPMMASDFATMGSIQADAAEGLSPREALYKSLTMQNDKLEQKKAALLSQMAENRPMSKSQTAAMMLIGMMPMLIGGLVKGKKGLAIGAEAGGLGAITAGKGIEAENERSRLSAKAQFDSVLNQQEKIQDTQNRSLLDEAKSADIATEKAKDRANKLHTAGITAGGFSKAMSGVNKALDSISKTYENEEKAQENKATKKAFSLADKIYTNTGAVKPENADKVKDAAKHYDDIFANLQESLEIIQSSDAGAIDRMIGNKSDRLYQLYSLSKNALADLKKIPGLKGTESFIALENMLHDPTSFSGNLKSAIAGTATIEEKLKNTSDLLESDFKRLLKNNSYTEINVGQTVKLKDGRQVIITGVADDGSLTFAPAQATQLPGAQ